MKKICEMREQWLESSASVGFSQERTKCCLSVSIDSHVLLCRWSQIATQQEMDASRREIVSYRCLLSSVTTVHSHRLYHELMTGAWVLILDVLTQEYI